VRYAGVLSSHSSLRAEVVPLGQPKLQLVLPLDVVGCKKKAPKSRSPRTSWAKMLARVFNIDVSTCPACGGQMRIVEFVTEPADIARQLGGAGSQPRAPPRMLPSQLEFPLLG
jgi:hypothetical protein